MWLIKKKKKKTSYTLSINHSMLISDRKDWLKLIRTWWWGQSCGFNPHVNDQTNFAMLNLLHSQVSPSVLAGDLKMWAPWQASKRHHFLFLSFLGELADEYSHFFHPLKVFEFCFFRVGWHKLLYAFELSLIKAGKSGIRDSLLLSCRETGF